VAEHVTKPSAAKRLDPIERLRRSSPSSRAHPQHSTHTIPTVVCSALFLAHSSPSCHTRLTSSSSATAHPAADLAHPGAHDAPTLRAAAPAAETVTTTAAASAVRDQSYGAGRGAPARSVEGKDNMMQSIRDSSQQDRRVYVGNLSYDVKWHHLKDFMRQCKSSERRAGARARLTRCSR
jgi:hypothetical protein